MKTTVYQMLPIFFFLILLYTPAVNASVPVGTCYHFNASGTSTGNENGITKAACESDARSRAPSFRTPPQYSYGSCVYDENPDVNTDKWMTRGDTTGQGTCTTNWGQRINSWSKTGTATCPPGTVENPTQTGCEAPTNPCTALQGQSVENIQVEFNRNSPNREAETLVKDGCKVNITSSGDVCVGLGANPDTITCFFSGTYTGEQATTGGEPVQQGTPPQNPQNPIVKEGATENPAPNQVLEKGDQILEYESDGLTYTVTETIEGDVLTTTTTKTNESGQVVQTIRVVEKVTEPTVTNVYNVSGGSAAGGGVSVSSGGTTQTGGGITKTTSGTTTYPDGSENSTCEGDECQGDGDGDGIPDNDGATEYTEANCNTVPWCKGDVIQCAQAREAWRTMCEVRNQAESIFGTEQERAAAQQQLTNEAQSVDTVEEMQEKVGITELNVGDLADFNTQLIPSGSSACPGDINITVWGNSFAISFAPLCALADSVRPLLLLFAYISAAVILYRALAIRSI
jgi:hypothetical protein